jgi:hypothetical protein
VTIIIVLVIAALGLLAGRAVTRTARWAAVCNRARDTEREIAEFDRFAAALRDAIHAQRGMGRR